MTVKELKKTLEEFEDDDIVIMSKDGEGNGFSPLADNKIAFITGLQSRLQLIVK